MMRRMAITALFLAIPGIAHAQAYQCRLPAQISVPKVAQDGQRRTLPTTGYTLALSWSPEFCKGREGQANHRMQCSGRNGRFGLIVHGLWPEGARSWPQYCPASRSLTAAELRRNLCMTPSPRLAAHEWAKHGSCMTRKPETYFKVTRILWNSLTLPDYDRLSRKDGLTAGDIRRALSDANERWEPEHIGVKLNSRGWLQELKLCYGKNFMPAPCDRLRWGASDSAKASIWRGL